MRTDLLPSLSLRMSARAFTVAGPREGTGHVQCRVWARDRDTRPYRHLPEVYRGQSRIPTNRRTH